MRAFSRQDASKGLTIEKKSIICLEEMPVYCVCAISNYFVPSVLLYMPERRITVVRNY